MDEQENKTVQEPIKDINNANDNEGGKYNLGPIQEPITKNNNTALVIILVVAILVICGSVVAMFVKSWIKDEIKSPEEFKGETTGQPNKNGNVDVYKEPEIDPYENFKNLTWATQITSDASIKDNKVYYGEVELDLEIEGTYKAIEVVKSISTAKVYLLTEDGEVWSFNVYFMTPGGEVDNVTRHLEDTKVLEMIYRDTNTLECIYFLTEKGELIDINKIPYDKYDFLGSISSNNATKIPYDENNYLYHWNEKKKEYEQIINKSKQKISAAKVIELATMDEVLIFTSKGYLFKYDGKTNVATQVEKDIKSVDFYKFKTTGDINMVITPKEGIRTVKYNVTYVYNVKDGTTMNLESLKTLDAYEKHKSIKWADSYESVGESINYRKIYCENDDMAYLVIGEADTAAKPLTLIDGVPVKAHIYRTMNALIDAEVTEAYVLTEEGKAYEVNADNGVTSELTNLSKYNIIDMACMGEEYKMMCFLTDTGDLLTYNGNLYE